MVRTFRAFILCTLLTALSTSPASAQSLPLGGRTASMGGAAIAEGRDSAMPFLNPAGLAQIPHHTVSVSASLYTQSGYRISNFWVPAGTDPEFGDVEVPTNDMSSSNFMGFPGSIAMMLHFGPPAGLTWHQVLSFSIVVPEHKHLQFDGNFALDFKSSNSIMKSTETLIRDSTTYYFGPGYAVQLGPVRLGLSAMVLYRTLLASVDASSTAVLSGGGGFTDSKTVGYGEGSSFGLVPILGMQWNVWEGLHVGLSVAPPSFHLAGSYRYSNTYEQNSPISVKGGSELSREIGEGTLYYYQPATLRFGIAWAALKRWTAALDVETALAQDVTQRQKGVSNRSSLYQNIPPRLEEAEFLQDTATALELKVRAGFEYFLSPMWALRAGVFYEPSNVPAFKGEASELMTFKVDRIGGSLGLGVGGELGETTFGVSFAAGQGTTIAGDSFSEASTQTSRYVPVTMFSYQAAFFVSGTVDFEEMRELLSDEIRKFGK